MSLRPASLSAMPFTGSSSPGRPIAWALLSQMIWLPLVGIDLHDRWQAQRRPPAAPGRGQRPAAATPAAPLSLAELLAASRGGGDRGGPSLEERRGLTSGGPALLAPARRHGERHGDGPPAAGELLLSSGGFRGRPSAAPGGLPRALMADADRDSVVPAGESGQLSPPFRGSQLLGGAIGLEDLQEGPMPALALVERSLRRSRHDPLAPLPEPWREPMRQALRRLPGSGSALDTARVITLPSSRIQQPAEVPLSLQSDGSVDILAAPAESALLRDVEHWSRQQPPPAPGRQAPALLRFQPLPAEAQAASSAAGAGSGVAGTPDLPAAGAAPAAMPPERRPPLAAE
ncbi:MAG: hypothetical protein VKJ44_09105 [Synechococcus sp.]|nr:hypothetical protein [Synechococcus sp.]